MSNTKMADGDQHSEKIAALEKALLDESVDPIDLPFSLLKSITGNFCEAQEIGRGGYGAVYKGVLPSGRIIAVKKLFERFEILDKNFESEVACLVGVKHKNTLRFLGYCSETQLVVMPYDGKLVCAEERQRLLCFEYICKGSIADYLSDASYQLHWTAIIKGICEGVHYLHQQRIIRMDLKPQNVLLDDNMVPRIADFGLSRRLSGSQSRVITENKLGTMGYMAPEFLNRGEITFKTDVYSLGVIIMEILMGHKECSNVEKVVESWTNKFGASKNQTSLEQVKVCAEIGIKCTNYDPGNRPATWFIVSEFEKMVEQETSRRSVTSDEAITEGQSTVRERVITNTVLEESRLLTSYDIPTLSAENLTMKELLIVCAKAVADDKATNISCSSISQDIIVELRKMVSVCGDPLQRLGAYMLEALIARIFSSGHSVCKALESDAEDFISYRNLLFESCPYLKFAYLSATGAIAEATNGEDRIHIIDFSICDGVQWVTLLQALARRAGGAPAVRITGIDDSVQAYTLGRSKLELVGRRLSRIAGACNVPFEFCAVAITASQLKAGHLGVIRGEVVAVNFNLGLHKISDDDESSLSQRDRILKLARSLSPRLVTLVEHELNTNEATTFADRFAETLDYYTAVFESVDLSLRRDANERIDMEQHCLGKDMVNLIACEGAERVERHELFGQWKARLIKAGFTPSPLSSHVNDTIKKMLLRYSCHYRFEERDGVLYLGWKDRPLVVTSAWH
ncbi:hypothetical protein CFC21_055512 [Triticum aestivum]|uniref:Protein kinase domain-containing protein n=2 Tax=Triticum aestivum TaxID=4565 RepID=A0A9R1GHM6_WHEAT|nr:chitin-inducible gibberellin-responsive protein 2-like isoform X2 [Triticum aestivum]KAF7046486.1 hypothetical protein CFC21_055512 [Triticum aestivum]